MNDAEQVIADAIHGARPISVEKFSNDYQRNLDEDAARIARALRAAGLLPGPDDIVVNREAHKLAGEVLEGASQHTDCDDCWYSCSTLTCDESRASTICDCGADKAAAALAALSQPHPEETTVSKPTFVIRMDRQRQDMAKPPAGMTRGEQQIREAFIDGFLSCAGNGEIYGADAARAWRDENETGRPSPAGADAVSATVWHCSSRCWAEGGPHDDECHETGTYETEIVVMDDGHPSIVVTDRREPPVQEQQ